MLHSIKNIRPATQWCKSYTRTSHWRWHQSKIWPSCCLKSQAIFCLFNSLLRPPTNIKALYYELVVRNNHWWLVVSPQGQEYGNWFHDMKSSYHRSWLIDFLPNNNTEFCRRHCPKAYSFDIVTDWVIIMIWAAVYPNVKCGYAIEYCILKICGFVIK